MIRRILLILVLSLFLASCGGAAASTEVPASTDAPAMTVPFVGEINTPTSEPPTETSTPAPTNTPAATSTDTPLPTLELPTEAISAPVRMVWDGTPTYLGDSTPGYSFRVTYDPDVWALTNDQFGFPALGHRNIPNCVISVTSGRGLPTSMVVEHDVIRTDT